MCRFWIRAGNNSYCTQYGTLLIHSVAEMADGTVRWTFGTAADAGTNRTWSAANTRRRSAALHALARWRTEPKCEGDTTRQRNNTRLDCAMHETKECGPLFLVAEEEEEDVEDEVGPSTREDDDDEEENDNEVDTVEKRGTSR